MAAAVNQPGGHQEEYANSYADPQIPPGGRLAAPKAGAHLAGIKVYEPHGSQLQEGGEDQEGIVVKLHTVKQRLIEAVAHDIQQ